MAKITIRPATVGDAAEIARLIGANAAFHGKPELARASEESVRRDGFGSEPLFWVLLALDGAVTIGILQYYFIYRGWQAVRALYVSDLYVDDAARRRGVGRMLMAAVARRAMETGCMTVRLGVQKENSARRFYERIGMQSYDDSVACSLEGEALARLAQR
jgi:ribosomal protein S18 acetylase RimI-like enzyme